ncbi:MAG: hypothetical protein AB8B58_05890 [Roseobacter sp.]
MRLHQDKGRLRQQACAKRARRAFRLAKLLIPVLLLTASASAWSDPVLGPRLGAGLSKVGPMVGAVIDGTPVWEALSDAKGRTDVAT